MLQGHGVILKGRVEIRLGGVPCIAGFRKEAQIRYGQGTDQLFFRRDTALVGLVGQNGKNQDQKKKERPIYGNVEQI